MPKDGISGPHLMAAFLCERVLQEKDGVLSFIRAVDRFTRPKPNPPAIPPAQIQVVLVLAFKAGDIGSGKYSIKIRLYGPSDSTPKAEMTNSVFFEGGQDQGASIVTPVVLIADEEGLYWIDVLFEDALVTRVPMRVILFEPPVIQQHGLAGA